MFVFNRTLNTPTKPRMTSLLSVTVPAVPSFIHPKTNTLWPLHAGDEREGYGIDKMKCSPLSSYQEETNSEV